MCVINNNVISSNKIERKANVIFFLFSHLQANYSSGDKHFFDVQNITAGSTVRRVLAEAMVV